MLAQPIRGTLRRLEAKGGSDGEEALARRCERVRKVRKWSGRCMWPPEIRCGRWRLAWSLKGWNEGTHSSKIAACDRRQTSPNSAPDQRRHLQWHKSSPSRTRSPPKQKHGFRGCHIPIASSKFCFGFTRSCSALNRSLKVTLTYSLEPTLWLLTANISLGLAAL